MNWETAKNWLIVAFLILDVVLGWQVAESRKEWMGYSESSSDLLANTKTILAEHGFSLNANVPLVHPDLPFVEADPDRPDLLTLMKAFFPHAESYNVDRNTGSGASADGTLKLAGAAWQVTYNRALRLQKADPTAVLAYVWQGHNYHLDEGLSTPISTDTTQTPASSVFVYTEQINQWPVFDASVTATIRSNNLIGYTQVSLSNLRTTGDNKPTISAFDALNNLANIVDKSMQRDDNRILSIALGYYHRDTTSSRESMSLPTATYWFPVWRVVTRQQIYYVNAFTGEVEGPDPR